MITLGIETSCDETALCLLQTEGNKYSVLGNLIHSQTEHGEFGGVVPMLAKREHIKNLPILYKKIIEGSKIKESDIDRIAVTYGPGLEPALWTGILFAKELSEKLGRPIYPINHMEGHIVSVMIDSESGEFKKVDFPALAILISGGHTEIINVKGLGKYEILGATLDDAVGEAFDKVARMLQLPYPGGPHVSELAEKARKENIKDEIKLPRPMIHSKDLNFSFSGLKTSVLYLLKEIGNINQDQIKDLCREFEDSVTEVLIEKTKKALENQEYRSLIIGGGVIANKHIRKSFESLADQYSIPLYLPISSLTGDNALMIALAGALNTTKPSVEGLVAIGNLSLRN
jgi:N6-L-threonylcarbamoyladenine synthase